MKQYEVLLPIKKDEVDAVIKALFNAGFAVYRPDHDATVAFTATDDQIQEVKLPYKTAITQGC